MARGATRDDAEMEYAAVVRARGGRPEAERPRRRAAGRAGAPPRRRARPRHHAWSVRTATSSADASAAPDARLPVRGYASHGESWSFALALRLASYDLLRADGDDPILILDDVFAELDTERRHQLADLVAGAEQVLVTAAVAADVPEALAGVRVHRRRRGGGARCLTRTRTPTRPARPATRPRAGRADGLDLARALTRASARSTPGEAGQASAAAAQPPSRVAGLRRLPRRARPAAARHDRRPAGRGPRLGARPAGARRLRPLGRAGRREIGAHSTPETFDRRQARGPHRLHRLGDPAEAARARPSYAGSTRSSGTAR